MIPLNRVKIDSFRIHIPIEYVTIISNNFNKKVVANVYEDGTIEDCDTHTTPPIFKTITGINCRFDVKKLLSENKQQRTFVRIIVNAKMLKQEYFNGIDKTNIHKVFKFINDTGIIQITKEDFLYANVYDVDFCVDVLLQDTTCKELVQTAYQLATPIKDLLIKPYTSAKNRGIQFGMRKTAGKSYETKQYLKYYAKLVSLKHDKKNTEFYETYVKDIIHEKTLFADGTEQDSPFNEDNFLRMETTLKNSNHFATYGKQVKTLKDLLQLDIKTDYSYFRRPQAHYMTSFRIIKHSTELNTTDKVYIEMLKLNASWMAMDIFTVIPYVVDKIHPLHSKEKDLKTKRNRLRKKFTELAIIDKKTMMENKTKKDIQKMIEFEKNNLIPKQ